MLKKFLTLCLYAIFCIFSIPTFVVIGTYALEVAYRTLNGIPWSEKLYQGDMILGLAMIAAVIPEIALGASFGIWLARRLLHQNKSARGES
jgi:hypothetical protein